MSSNRSVRRFQNDVSPKSLASLLASRSDLKPLCRSRNNAAKASTEGETWVFSFVAMFCSLSFVACCYVLPVRRKVSCVFLSKLWPPLKRKKGQVWSRGRLCYEVADSYRSLTNPYGVGKSLGVIFDPEYGKKILVKWENAKGKSEKMMNKNLGEVLFSDTVLSADNIRYGFIKPLKEGALVEYTLAGPPPQHGDDAQYDMETGVSCRFVPCNDCITSLVTLILFPCNDCNRPLKRVHSSHVPFIYVIRNVYAFPM